MTQEDLTLDDNAGIARNLHFVRWDGYNYVCRPAIVVNDWPRSGRSGYVNLVVFTDGTNDGEWGTDKHQHSVPNEPKPIETRSRENSPKLMVKWMRLVR